MGQAKPPFMIFALSCATLAALSRPYPPAEERWLGLESLTAPASAPPAQESPTG